MANQHLGQVHDTVDAILGNVGTLLLFRLGIQDAQRLADYGKPELTGQDLRMLPDHHAAACLLARGRPLQPFVMETAVPAAVPDRPDGERHARETLLSEICRQYTRPIEEVEQRLHSPYKLPARACPVDAVS